MVRTAPELGRTRKSVSVNAGGSAAEVAAVVAAGCMADDADAGTHARV